MLHAVAGTIAALLIVRRNVIDEPYTSFAAGDALTQIGLGCALIVVWVYVFAGVVYGVFTTRLSRTWFGLLPWAALMVFLLAIGTDGYIEDLLGHQAARSAALEAERLPNAARPGTSPAARLHRSGDILGQYEKTRQADWPAAAKTYIEAVEGNRLADFDPEPENTAARLLQHGKQLAAKGNEIEAATCFKRVADDFPLTAEGPEAALMMK